MDNKKIRCQWAGSDPIYIRYHDTEWGVPVFDDEKLFEFLILEGMQAGLSWITILKKRENFASAFDDFKAEKIACYNRTRLESLMNNSGIIRNRRKIDAAVGNARAYLKAQETHGTFSAYIWQFIDGTPVRNAWKSIHEVPAETPESTAMSKDLKNRGFRFVGPTICYAFMQAVGMVNDHTVDCFRYHELSIRE
jgi:DNA-3-methyladenine glycosylase I